MRFIGSWWIAFDDVFSSARGKVSEAQKKQLGGRFPTILIPDYSDPGQPGWLDANPTSSAVPSKAKQSININALNSTPAPFV